MALTTLDSAFVNVPLLELPVAAAAVDKTGMITAANRPFVRLSGLDGAATVGRSLADIVVETGRPAIAAALSRLGAQDGLAPGNTCRITAQRAKSPSIRISIDVGRLGVDSPIPYLACLQPVPRKRKAPSTASNGRVWPPALMTLSHEFRGPLTAIRGWVQLAESASVPSETVTRALSVIAHNAESLSDMVDNLFDLSRWASGSLSLKSQALDLSALTYRVVESTLPAARQRRVTLTMRRSGAPLVINGDAHRVDQVIRNLVENAIKFTPPEGHVRVHTERDGVFATVVITDTGLGITPICCR